MAARPMWADWPMEPTPHVAQRAFQRGVSLEEVEGVVRRMAEWGPGVEGRFWVVGRVRGMRVKVIVEPDVGRGMMVVITVMVVE